MSARQKSLLAQLAFWASVLLGLLLLDAGFPPPPEPPAAALEEQTARLSLEVSSRVGQELAGLSATISRELEAGIAPGQELALAGGQGSVRLPKGAYYLIVRAQGHARYATKLSLHEDHLLRVELEAALVRDVDVVVEEAGQLRPLPEATVLVQAPGALPHGRATDASGRAHFDALPSGELSVLVYAPGYEPYEAMLSGDLLVRLRPVRSLRVVVQRDGQPQPEATVWISGLSLWPARAVQTGPRGHVDVTGLRAGRYALSAELGELVSGEEKVELLAEKGREEVRLELGPGSFVVARVHDPEGKPILSAQVTHASGGLDTRTRHGETDSTGMVRLGPLRELHGDLQVRARGFVPQVVAVSGSMPQDIELSPAGEVAGRVVDARGMPVAGASVEVVGTDIFGMPVALSTRSTAIAEAHFDWALRSQNVLIPAGELGVLLGPVPEIPLAGVTPLRGEQLTTNEKGYFQMPDVPPGKLVVLARHPDHVDGRSEPFSLGPDGKKQVEVVLGQGRPLRGRVTDHRGFPVSHARVRVTGAHYDRTVSASEDGSFFVGAAPEVLQVRISVAARPLSVLLEVPVSAKQRGEELELSLPEPREDVSVRCLDERADPVGLVQVTLVSADPRIPVRLTRFSDRSGELLLEAVRGLPVRLEVSAPGFVSQTEKLTLKSELVLRLEPSVSARGRLTTARGRQPAAGARVHFAGGGVQRSTTSDELGEYHLTDLPPGPGLVRAEHPEHGKASQAVRISAPGAARELELPSIDLTPPAQVKGLVVDDAGRPVAGAWLAADRLSAYVPFGARLGELGLSDAEGRFEVEVPQAEARYLFAMVPAKSFGFSDLISLDARGSAADVRVLLDRTDEAAPDARATVLVSLEEDRGRLRIYAVAPGSAAARAGLAREDLLLRIDSRAPSSVAEARELLTGTPGSDVLLELSSRGQTKSSRVLRESFQR